MPFELSADLQSYDSSKEVTNISFEGPVRSHRHEVADKPRPVFEHAFKRQLHTASVVAVVKNNSAILLQHGYGFFSLDVHGHGDNGKKQDGNVGFSKCHWPMNNPSGQ